jgi:hypothetical protein
MFFEHARSIVSPRSQSAIMIGVIAKHTRLDEMHTAKTHTILHGLVAAALVIALAGPGAAAVKKTAYPEVKVTLDASKIPPQSRKFSALLQFCKWLIFRLPPNRARIFRAFPSPRSCCLA